LVFHGKVFPVAQAFRPVRTTWRAGTPAPLSLSQGASYALINQRNWRAVPAQISGAPNPAGQWERRASSRCSLAGRAAGQGERETGPAVDLAFGPDAAAVALDNALHQGQPHPGAFKFLVAVQPLKHPE
jgi:hypothetical protein